MGKSEHNEDHSAVSHPPGLIDLGHILLDLWVCGLHWPHEEVCLSSTNGDGPLWLWILWLWILWIPWLWLLLGEIKMIMKKYYFLSLDIKKGAINVLLSMETDILAKINIQRVKK